MIERFSTDLGLEIEAVTAEEMRAVDRVAIEETGPNLYQMMENAGRNLAELVLERLGSSWSDQTIVVLAGTGGNGGGGICAARHLANRGARVQLCVSTPRQLSEVPAQQLAVYRATGQREVPLGELIASPRIVVDAVLGYSLEGAPRGSAASMVGWVNDRDSFVLSLDVPTGIDSTTGEAPGVFIRASKTMTLALPKTGLVPEKVSNLVLADIGIPGDTYQRLGLSQVSPFGDRYRVPLEALISRDETNSLP